MRKSDHDLEMMADEIVARMDQGSDRPQIREISNYIDGLGFSREDADTLGRLVVAKTQYGGLKPRHIIVLLHGIRTNAEWQGLAVDAFSPYCLKVIPVKYGFFDVISFWFPITPFFRGMPIRRVEDELKSVIADYSNVHVSVVAHSFGTYIISRVLKRNFNIRLFRLLMCGSIIPLRYDWRRLPNKPRGGLMNDIGTKDRLPILAETLTWGYGASGTYGFGTAEVDENYHDFGHSGFFSKDHVNSYWVPFLFHGTYVKSPINVTRNQPGYGWELLRLLKIKYVAIGAVAWFVVKPAVAAFLHF